MILERFPHYADAQPVEELDAEALSQSDFHSKYVAASRPFVARGAAKHWAACKAWNPQVLRERMKTVENIFQKGGFVTETVLELGDRKFNMPQEKASEFLERLERGERATAYGVSLDNTAGMDDVWADFGSMPFYLPKRKSGFIYENRAFIYRGGYTDWHYHDGDESLTVQLLGTKEFLLLPCDALTFDALYKIARSETFDKVNFADHPELMKLRPYRVVLRPGDAIYIPIFWWHAVEPVDDEIGFTAAFVFPTPIHIQCDLRLRGVRQNMIDMVNKRPPDYRIPLVLAGAAYSFLRHPLSPPHLPRAR